MAVNLMRANILLAGLNSWRYTVVIGREEHAALIQPQSVDNTDGLCWGGFLHGLRNRGEGNGSICRALRNDTRNG
jgi:hypothetical protein